MSASPTSTRSRRSEHRRDDLLDAAEALFAERGVIATAVSDITERAGVAKGTFYLYFDSKDHVVAGLKERAVAGMMAIVEHRLVDLDDADLYEVADELTAAIIEYWLEKRELFRAIRESGESPLTADLQLAYDQRIIAMLEAGLRLGIERGFTDLPDPARAAQFIYYGCQGVTTAALLAPGDVDRDALIGGAQAVLRRILR